MKKVTILLTILSLPSFFYNNVQMEKKPVSLVEAQFGFINPNVIDFVAQKMGENVYSFHNEKNNYEQPRRKDECEDIYFANSYYDRCVEPHSNIDATENLIKEIEKEKTYGNLEIAENPRTRIIHKKDHSSSNHLTAHIPKWSKFLFYPLQDLHFTCTGKDEIIRKLRTYTPINKKLHTGFLNPQLDKWFKCCCEDGDKDGSWATSLKKMSNDENSRLSLSRKWKNRN